MIFKVQIPIATNEPEPKALIYNKHRTIEGMIPVTPDLVKTMNGDYKAYFTGQFKKGTLTLGDRVEDQDW